MVILVVETTQSAQNKNYHFDEIIHLINSSKELAYQTVNYVFNTSSI